MIAKHFKVERTVMNAVFEIASEEASNVQAVFTNDIY